LAHGEGRGGGGGPREEIDVVPSSIRWSTPPRALPLHGRARDGQARTATVPRRGCSPPLVAGLSDSAPALTFTHPSPAPCCRPWVGRTPTGIGISSAGTVVVSLRAAAAATLRLLPCCMTSRESNRRAGTTEVACSSLPALSQQTI
jgi:hypothetical protein